MTGNDAFLGVVPGQASGGPLNPISIGVPAGTPSAGNLPFQFMQPLNVASAVTLFGGFPGSALEIFIQALAENQYLRLLAEPTIIALSGQEASFLAGGEFPVPVVQGSSGGGTSITVEYKEFGVRLRFLPTVLGDGRIRLHVAPEVSQTSTLNAVTIEGFQIPSLVTRRAETTLELNSGQTFAMAGLINRVDNARNSRVPGLGDLPVLGALFRSVRYQQDETDLVVMVTASFVEPLSTDEDFSDLPVPGSLHVIPNEWELYGLGRIGGRAPAQLSEAQSAWLSETGLDKLRGAGAWATYDQAPAQGHLPTPQSATQPER
jgi:pilus assembly protein CpaC